MKKYVFLMFCIVLNYATVKADMTPVVAGYSVDSIRTPGNVSVSSGTKFEIEATGTVTLQGGFSVEQGATFAVYPSSF